MDAATSTLPGTNGVGKSYRTDQVLLNPPPFASMVTSTRMREQPVHDTGSRSRHISAQCSAPGSHADADRVPSQTWNLGPDANTEVGCPASWSTGAWLGTSTNAMSCTELPLPDLVQPQQYMWVRRTAVRYILFVYNMGSSHSQT